ncbi:hypothetical protein [Candidatus Formimonas warabiya]|uniref:Prenylated flavin chaperone LpdD-like domain-containing protein n=1 Tax=Formimonas warabiya TaxID=1761012 RepID=A0A3G1KXL2_FORW1|nr:hypothetical protein [Candidatus Formimonas warabiya]ATW27263.1 hypothetical protein DCMF_23140 [Candidatus Formimonas warabiya]
MENFTIEAGEENHKVILSVSLTEQGISTLLTGGDRPHVGGMVLAVPRTSLTGSGISSDVWIVPVPGHKDVTAAEQVATVICRETGEVVAVTAGIHIDGATGKDLELILKNVQEGARLAAAECKKRKTK